MNDGHQQPHYYAQQGNGHGQPGLSLDQVKEYVVALQNSLQDRKAHKIIDRKLRQFQKTKQAWAIAVTLIQIPSGEPYRVELTHFGATTLVDKIRHDCEKQLSSENDQMQLCNTLLNAVYTMYSEIATGSSVEQAAMRPSFKELALALAALAVRVQGWDDFVGGIVQAFVGKQSNSSNEMIQLGLTNVPLPSMEVLPCILSVIKELPEEANYLMEKRSLGQERNQKIQAILNQSSPGVLNLLNHVFHDTSSQNSHLSREVFRCFTSWLKCASPSPDQVSQSVLIDYAFTSIQNEDAICDVALDSIIQVVTSFNIPDNHRVVMEKIARKAVQFHSIVDKAVTDEDLDSLWDLARLFVNIGEEFIDWILRETSAIHRNILDIIVRCTASEDVDISGLTIPFWNHLVDEFSNLSSEQLRSNFRMQLETTLKTLVTVLTNVIQFPTDFGSWKADQKSDFKHGFRYDISDVYLGLCKVIGSSAVLEILAARLDKQLRIFRETNGNGSTDGETGLYVGTWQGVEATMYAIKSIGRYVPPDEARVLPVLMNRETLQMFPGNSEMRATIFRLIGRYAFWLKQRTYQDGGNTLNSMVSLLLEFLSIIIPNNPFAVEASNLTLALARITEECGASIGVDKFNQLTGAIQQMPDYLVEELLLALTRTALGFDDESTAQECLHSLFKPNVDGIKEFSTAPGDAGGKASAYYHRMLSLRKQAKESSEGQGDNPGIPSSAGHDRRVAASLAVCSYLKRMKSIIKTIGSSKRYENLRKSTSEGLNHPVTNVIFHLWEDLQNVSNIFFDDINVHESLSSVYKHAIGAAKLAFAPLLENMVSVILVTVEKNAKDTADKWKKLINENRSILAGETGTLLDQEVAEKLMEAFFHSGYVYLASVIVREYGRIASARNHLVNLTTKLTHHVNHLLPVETFPPVLSHSLAELMPSGSVMRYVCLYASSNCNGVPTEDEAAIGFPMVSAHGESTINALAVRLNYNPELADDWFTLAERAFDMFPREYLNSHVASTALQLCFAGFKCAHSLVINAVCSYMTTCLSFGLQISDAQQDLKASYEQNISNNLLTLNDRLLAGVAGALPISKVDDPDGSVAEVAFGILQLVGNQKYKEMTEISINSGTIPRNAFEENELNEIAGELTNVSDRNELVSILKKVAKHCQNYREDRI